jgi:hypothetical protein
MVGIEWKDGIPMLGQRLGAFLLLHKENQYGRFRMFKVNDYVMVNPSTNSYVNAYHKVYGDKVHVITHFYISIAGYKCASVKPVNEDDPDVGTGVRVRNLTPATLDVAWEV